MRPRRAAKTRVQTRIHTRIHDGLVGDRALIGTPYLADPELRRQYQEEIAPRTTAALGKILDQIAIAHAPRRVLDLGSGTGAAAAALRARFSDAEIVRVDRVAAPGVVTANLERDGAPAALAGRFDLIVAAHLLNELFVALPEPERLARRARLARLWIDRLLCDQGLLIIVEPALRETSRELLGVRDRLLAPPASARVVAPCFWTGSCPALARDRDWCHDAAPAGAGRVDFSYLVLAPAATPAAAAPDPSRFRIVSDPLVEKGRLRLFGCGPTGRHALVRLDRQRSAANAALDDLRRGDVAEIRPTSPAGDGLRILPETQVTIPQAPLPARRGEGE